MSRLLSPQELVLLQQDTDYLNAGMLVWESRVAYWSESKIWILIYRSQTEGYIVSDITDLGQARIDALAQQSTVHGIWYYLSRSTTEILSEDVESIIAVAKMAGQTTAEIAQSAATEIGETLANLLTPVVGSLTLPLVITGLVIFFYLYKKG